MVSLCILSLRRLKVAMQWLIHCTRSLLIIRDHPKRSKATSEVERLAWDWSQFDHWLRFLGISKAGVAREGKDSVSGFQQKLVDLRRDALESLGLKAEARSERAELPGRAWLGHLGAGQVPKCWQLGYQEHYLLVVTQAAPQVLRVL